MLRKMAVVIGTCCVFMTLGIVLFGTGVAHAAGSASIHGVVRDAVTGIGIAGVRVIAKPVTSYSLCDTTGISATTDLDGYYSINGVYSGPYQVRFEVAPTLTANSTVAVPSYISQWYGGGSDEKASTVLKVVAPQALQGIDAILERGGSISGTVFDAAGPLGSVQVTAKDSKGLKRMASSNFDGTYSIAGLPTGSYTLSFATQSSPFLPMTQYLPVTLPSPVSVTAPINTTGVDLVFTLPGGAITGTLTGAGPSDMVAVSAQLRGSSNPAASTMVFMGATTFEIGGLVSGIYDVVINSIGSLSGFLPVQKNGVVVTAPNTTNIGSTSLTVGGSIQGTVKAAAGALPVPNAYVIAYQGATMAGFGFSSADGTYAISGLPSGSYTVQFSYCQGGLTEQWYNGKNSQSTANAIAVTAPQTVSAVNGTLDLSRFRFAPVALPQNVQVVAGSGKSITLDADEYNGSRLTYTLVSQPAHGTVSGLPPNVVYNPAAGYSGADSFTFKVNDGTTDSNVAAVSLAVAAASRQMKGDVNGDGVINIFDVLLTLQYVVNLVPHTAELLQAADVVPLDPVNLTPKGNGVVEIADALMILRRVLHLEPWAPTGGGTTLALLTPVNGASGVSPGSSVLVSSSKILDAASLKDSTVMLQQIGPYGMTVVAGMPAYDAGRQELAFGNTQLQADYLYKLVFSGVKDLGGFPVPDSTFTFKTARSPLKRSVSKNFNGAIDAYNDCTLNTAANPILCAYYANPGLDGVWFTNDDVVQNHEIYSYDISGNLVRMSVYEKPGLDGNWFSADDPVLSYSAYSYDAQGRIIRIVTYYGPGADGVWFTADDAVGYYEAYEYDAKSRLSRVIRYNGPGTDGLWFSAADEVAEYEVSSYDPVGRLSGKCKYLDAGPDNIWFTADDTVSYFDKKLRNAEAQIMEEVLFSTLDSVTSQPGKDVWSIGEVLKYKKYVYDTANGRFYRTITYGNPGTDAVWNTPDDTIFGYCEFTYDNFNRIIRNSCFKNQGANGAWFDADDVETGYEVYTP